MKKKLFLIPAVIVGMSLVACGGGDKPEPEPEVTYNLSLVGTDALEIISQDKPTKGKDLKVDIAINDFYKNYCQLPNAVSYVKIGSSEFIQDYTYEKGTDKGTIQIPANLITGDVEIKALALADSIKVSLTDASFASGVRLTDPETTIGNNYTSSIYLADEVKVTNVLPSKEEFSSDTNITVKVTDKSDKQTYEINKSIIEYNPNPTCSMADITIPSKVKKSEGGTEFILTGDVSIEMQSKTVKYDVTSESETLEFTNADTEEKEATRGVEYTSEMSIKSSASGSLPTTLDITIGGKPFSYYKIEEEKITIPGEFVNGNIHIKGEAIPDPDPKTIKVAIESKYVNHADIKETTVGKECVIKFSKDSKHEMPTEDNVRVYIGKPEDVKVTDWYVPNSEKESGGIKYAIAGNESALVIPAALLDSSSKVMYVAACAPDVSLLQELSWEEIADYSKAGYAKYLFEIGEVSKPFTIGDRQYTARIIDFNRDAKDSATRNPAGITFEFTSCVEVVNFSKDGQAIDTYYKEPYTSNLYDYLDKTLYPKLLSGLGLTNYPNAIEEIIKVTLAGVKGSSAKENINVPSHLFPLSYHEIGLTAGTISAYNDEAPYYKHEGEAYNGAYNYYKKHNDDSHRIKEIYNAEPDINEPSLYWLRTPAVVDTTLGNMIISKKGARLIANPTLNNCAVAPAFCI